MVVEPLQIGLSLLIGASVFLLIFSLFRFPVATAAPVHRRMAKALRLQEKPTLFEQPGIAPVMSLALTAAKRFNIGGLRRKIRQDLDAAGNPGGYSVDEYLALCFGSAALLGVLWFAASIFLFQQLSVVGTLVAALIGFAIPIFDLGGKARKRTQAIGRQLPYTLDLIALMMSSGSTFAEATAVVIRDNPEDQLNQELRIVQAETEIGTSRADALRNMANRIPLDNLRSIVGAINQAESLGSPLAEILSGQAQMLRMQRSVRAEKLSATASLSILVPSMLIMMSVVIFVFGPTLVRWWRGEFAIS